MLKLHFCETFGHQTRQNCGLWQGATNYKVAYPFDHVLTRVYIVNRKGYISHLCEPMATKRDRLIAYEKGPPPTKSFRVCLQTKLIGNFIFRNKTYDWHSSNFSNQKFYSRSVRYTKMTVKTTLGILKFFWSSKQRYKGIFPN